MICSCSRTKSWLFLVTVSCNFHNFPKRLSKKAPSLGAGLHFIEKTSCYQVRLALLFLRNAQLSLLFVLSAMLLWIVYISWKFCVQLQHWSPPPPRMCCVLFRPFFCIWSIVHVSFLQPIKDCKVCKQKDYGGELPLEVNAKEFFFGGGRGENMKIVLDLYQSPT